MIGSKKKNWIGVGGLGELYPVLVWIFGMFLTLQSSLLDHGFWYDHLVHELTEFPSHGLSVLELDIHLHRLALQSLDLTADAAEVDLEPGQHVLHPLQRNR